MFHNISSYMLYQKAGPYKRNLPNNSRNVKTLYMTIMVSAAQLMKLPPLRVLPMSDAHIEDSPCLTKLHGILHVLETSAPSVVQLNSIHHQYLIQILHSGPPAAEFLYV